MRSDVISLLVLSALLAYAEAQYGYYPAPMNNYFRAGLPQSSFPEERESSATSLNPDGRFFFSTVTVTIATTTSTSTSTVSTTCTTSTATLKTCSPSGRRRRGMSLTGNKEGRGIFYNEEDHEHADGSIFLPIKKIEEPEVKESERNARAALETSVAVPYVVQPGFNLPQGLGNGRFLLAFGTSTVTTVTTSTYTAILTATCSSTTGFSSCASSG